MADTQHDRPVLTLDELMDLLHDKERLLREYSMKRMHGPGSGMDGKAREKFQLHLPYDDIKAVVMRERDLIFSNVEEGAIKPRFEHVGSTSIKGMPGMPIPDGLILDKQFPPSRSTVQTLLISGWNIAAVHPLDPNDVWFKKDFHNEDSPCKHMMLHVTSEDNKLAQILQLTRDRCNNDPEAFDNYKSAKVKAALGEQNNEFSMYKQKKGNCELLTGLRKEVGLEFPPQILKAMGNK